MITVPHSLSRQAQPAHRRRDAAGRHGRSHAGLSARGGQARARAQRHRDHPGAQPSHSGIFYARSITLNPFGIIIIFIEIHWGRFSSIFDGLEGRTRPLLQPPNRPPYSYRRDPSTMPSLSDSAIRQAIGAGRQIGPPQCLDRWRGGGTGRLVSLTPEADANPRDSGMDGSAMARRKAHEIQDRLLSRAVPRRSARDFSVISPRSSRKAAASRLPATPVGHGRRPVRGIRQEPQGRRQVVLAKGRKLSQHDCRHARRQSPCP